MQTQNCFTPKEKIQWENVTLVNKAKTLHSKRFAGNLCNTGFNLKKRCDNRAVCSYWTSREEGVQDQPLLLGVVRVGVRGEEGVQRAVALEEAHDAGAALHCNDSHHGITCRPATELTKP